MGRPSFMCNGVNGEGTWGDIGVVGVFVLVVCRTYMDVGVGVGLREVFGDFIEPSSVMGRRSLGSSNFVSAFDRSCGGRSGSVLVDTAAGSSIGSTLAAIGVDSLSASTFAGVASVSCRGVRSRECTLPGSESPLLAPSESFLACPRSEYGPRLTSPRLGERERRTALRVLRLRLRLRLRLLLLLRLRLLLHRALREPLSRSSEYRRACQELLGDAEIE